MADTLAKKAADYIIAFSHDCGDPISNLKLQKLLYYSQAWYLALYGKPLFDERIESLGAWSSSSSGIWGAYKGWAWQPIQDNPSLDSVGLPGAVKAHLNEIMDAYGSMGAYDLEKLTHSEAPWLNSRGGIPIDQASNALISHEEMKKFYRLAIDGKD